MKETRAVVVPLFFAGKARLCSPYHGVCAMLTSGLYSPCSLVQHGSSVESTRSPCLPLFTTQRLSTKTGGPRRHFIAAYRGRQLPLN
ncbi:hypothetical protein LJC27_03130 [Christensenellaceae bacterium OttesenSCG-928-M15]|nr:hypothetical protein [Christensenellaceae bacterium OttesenSCG-928-M15]